MKTRWDNDMIDGTSVVYAENETKLLWSIEHGALCDENQIVNDMTNHIGVVYAKIETKLSWPIGQGVVYDENQIR